MATTQTPVLKNFDGMSELCLFLVVMGISLLVAALLLRRIRCSYSWEVTLDYMVPPAISSAALAVVALWFKPASDGASYLFVMSVFFWLVRLFFCVFAWIFRPTRPLNNLLKFLSLIILLAMGLSPLRLPAELTAIAEAELNLGASKISLSGLFDGFLAGAIFFVAAVSISRVAERWLFARPGLHHNLALALANIGRGGIWMVAVLLTLLAVGVNINTIVAFGGALGIGLGFGLQRLASSYVSGLIILFEQSIRVGDYIVAGNVKGRVVRIRTRHTMLLSSDGREAIVPNDVLTSMAIVNESWSDSNLRLSVTFWVALDSGMEEVKQAVLQAIATQPRVLALPLPSVYIRAVEPLGVQLEANFWIADPENGQANIISDVNGAVIDVFRVKGIVFVRQSAANG